MTTEAIRGISRRNFIKASGAILGALSFLGISPAALAKTDAVPGIPAGAR